MEYGHQGKPLSELLNELPDALVSGDVNVVVRQITLDSRMVAPGSLFVAVKGTQADGHQFIPEVVKAGAIAVLCEAIPEETFGGVVYISVENPAYAMGLIASAFYDFPSRNMKLIGITGTNGKTSVATFLFQLFRGLGYRCGLLSTVQNQIEDEIIPSTHTTPDAPALNALLAKMQSKGCSHVFMEVSSHAVVQHRIAGLEFSGGIFTNITHDHLDFHKTFDNYIQAKKGFFDTMPAGSFALVNADDRRGSVMVQNTRATVATYSLQAMATFRARILDDSLAGMTLNIDNHEVWFKLVGKFNAYNLLAAYGAAVLAGESQEEILTVLSGISSPSGRFELVRSDLNVVAIVDYAHTPDALQNVLDTITHLRTRNEQVITVVGCGGNRDTTKRPKMAAIACKLSDKVILTSDNPRFEDPVEILEQMKAGVPALDYKKTIVIPDRREAIRQAADMAQSGDIILIAGKGHENYQDVKGVKHHFDDKEEVRMAFESIEGIQ